MHDKRELDHPRARLLTHVLVRSIDASLSEIQHNGSDRSHRPTHGYVSRSSAIPALRTSAFLRCFKLGGCLMNMCCKRSFGCIENGTTVVLLFQRLGMAARVGSSVVGLMAALAPPAKARGTRSMWVALAAPIALGLATSMVQRAGPIVHTLPLLVRMFWWSRCSEYGVGRADRTFHI